jgi:hypothetical protein
MEGQPETGQFGSKLLHVNFSMRDGFARETASRRMGICGAFIAITKAIFNATDLRIHDFRIKNNPFGNFRVPFRVRGMRRPP